MARYALCVGINEFKTLPRSSWLSGCVNDANDLSKALRKLGFTARNVTVLRDREATKKKVMAALTTMVGKAKPGDHVVFTFSSHGTQVASLAGDQDEEDALDEAFACYDLKQGGDDWDRKTVIVDDELRSLFETVPQGVLLEVLLDTCHSGTGLKDLDDIQQAMLLGRRPRFLPPPTPRGLQRARSIRATSTRTVDKRPLAELTRGGGAKPVLYAACRPEQTAADADFDHRANGAFTYLFLKALAEDPSQTRRQLQSAVLKGLKSGDFEQRSTLEGPPQAKKVPFGQPW
ncbi:MAG: caspase family protein [Marmoricola sp.]